ncbi:hypothetical protein [Comamonas aquatica]|uniref:hypothetical protein n=1 Tax=Comamonas aquatica TaxID=225991 RepID=UPI0024472386|nr:hypothetical protein [Comamonas aquatica]MDH1619206.1 hypothetical protein [Comamonas aquatica]
MKKDDIIIVACCFRLSPEDMLNRLRSLIGTRSSIFGYIVCANASIERTLAPGWILLPSDNRDFDFSAYLKGAERVRQAHPESRAVVFLNDTLFTNHAAAANFNALWRQVGLIQYLELPAIAGKTDPYTTVCLRNPWSGLGHYVTTFCFMLNRHAITFMFQLRAMADRDGVTLERSVDDPLWANSLPPAFRQFLKANLVYAQSPYLWYRLKEAKYSSQQISSKARAIYFEHRLSGVIGDAGCILPTNSGPRWAMYLRLHELLRRFLKIIRIG